VLADVLVFLIVVALIGGLIYVMASPNRYARMTDQEFEEDTKKGSVLGAAVIGMERALRRREADFVIEQKMKVEKDATPAGDHPPDENLDFQRHKRLN
jgi:hypothetical protein